MDRTEYISTKHKLIRGQLDDSGMNLFYEFWLKNKKEDYENIDFELFKSKFNFYLLQGINFQQAVGKVLSHFDNEFTIMKIINIKNNNVLLEI